MASEKGSPGQLRLIEEIDDTAPPEPATDRINDLAMGLLLTALKALSQRSLVALASLQVTLAIGSVLFLGYKVLLLPAPSITQVTGTAIYAVFVLIALWLRR